MNCAYLSCVRRYKTHAFLIGTLTVQILLVRLAALNPLWIEQYYSRGLYPYISRAMRIGLGWIPFSYGDIVYTLLIVLLISWIWKFFKKLKKSSTGNSFKVISIPLKQVLTATNILYAFFHLSWGMNYYRQPLNEQLNLAKEYEDDDLFNITNLLLVSTNSLHAQLQPDDSLKVGFPQDQKPLYESALQALNPDELALSDRPFGPLSTKKSLLTLPLSYMGYSGYLNPLTGEAQINGYIRNYKTPVLILHEMAHQLGYAKENEANFVAIYSGLRHPDPKFRLSAQMFALRYCLRDVYRRDPKKYEAYAAKMRQGMKLNYKELTDFWEDYEGAIEEISQVTYGQYLKANNQPGGMKSYGYVTSLFVNFMSKPINQELLYEN